MPGGCATLGFGTSIPWIGIYHTIPIPARTVPVMVYCSKKVLTSRISSPDKYQQVVLGVCRGVYGPIVDYCESYEAFWINVG